uniref:Spermatogenesis associated 1 n=1 Tax=Pavo cristatus TaxID=9049 RepID=A0A8C9G0N7_PAVCR
VSIRRKIRKPIWDPLWSSTASSMSFGQTRPQTSQLVELHVFFVPEEVWNFKLNTVPVALASKFISAGFIRVSPHITLRMLREKLGEYLGGVAVADKFQFLKCIGKKLAVVKAKQEAELELKSFAPPNALYPELYLLPRVEYFEDVYPLSSSTQQRHHFNAETNRYGHGSRLPDLPQQKTRSKQFLDSIQSSHQQENQKVHSPAEWSEKEFLPVLRMSREQDHNRITETQTQFRVKEKKMVEQLEQMKKDRRHMEKNREELVKKVKTLLEQNKLKRYHVREEWKKKYFETKKATVSLEDVLSKLRQDLELCHQKLLLQLEARDSRQQPNDTTNSKNNRIIQITTVQHELDQLRRKLDDTKMKLVIEIKMRKQAIADLRALRAELTQKKIHSALILQSGKSGI